MRRIRPVSFSYGGSYVFTQSLHRQRVALAPTKFELLKGKMFEQVQPPAVALVETEGHQSGSVMGITMPGSPYMANISH